MSESVNIINDITNANKDITAHVIPAIRAINKGSDYDDLGNKPIYNKDLSSSTFTPVEGNYYRHTGTTSSDFTNGTIYRYLNSTYIDFTKDILATGFSGTIKTTDTFTPVTDYLTTYADSSTTTLSSTSFLTNYKFQFDIGRTVNSTMCIGGSTTYFLASNIYAMPYTVDALYKYANNELTLISNQYSIYTMCPYSSDYGSYGILGIKDSNDSTHLRIGLLSSGGILITDYTIPSYCALVYANNYFWGFKNEEVADTTSGYTYKTTVYKISAGNDTGYEIFDILETIELASTYSHKEYTPVVCDNNIYIVCGKQKFANTVSGDTGIYKFDTTTKQISKIGDFPYSMTYVPCVGAGKYIYTFGGFNYTTRSSINDVYKINTESGLCHKSDKNRLDTLASSYEFFSPMVVGNNIMYGTNYNVYSYDFIDSYYSTSISNSLILANSNATFVCDSDKYITGLSKENGKITLRLKAIPTYDIDYTITQNLTKSTNILNVINNHIPSKVSEFENDSNYTTITAVDTYMKEHQSDWNVTTTTNIDYIKNKPSYLGVNNTVETLTNWTDDPFTIVNVPVNIYADNAYDGNDATVIYAIKDGDTKLYKSVNGIDYTEVAYTGIPELSQGTYFNGLKNVWGYNFSTNETYPVWQLRVGSDIYESTDGTAWTKIEGKTALDDCSYHQGVWAKLTTGKNYFILSISTDNRQTWVDHLKSIGPSSSYTNIYASSALQGGYYTNAYGNDEWWWLVNCTNQNTSYYTSNNGETWYDVWRSTENYRETQSYYTSVNCRFFSCQEFDSVYKVVLLKRNSEYPFELTILSYPVANKPIYIGNNKWALYYGLTASNKRRFYISSATIPMNEEDWTSYVDIDRYTTKFIDLCINGNYIEETSWWIYYTTQLSNLSYNRMSLDDTQITNRFIHVYCSTPIKLITPTTSPSSRWQGLMDVNKGAPTVTLINVVPKVTFDSVLINDGLAETSVHGIPSGGTQGQFLVKSSSTDYDCAWTTITNLNNTSF